MYEINCKMIKACFFFSFITIPAVSHLKWLIIYMIFNILLEDFCTTIHNLFKKALIAIVKHFLLSQRKIEQKIFTLFWLAPYQQLPSMPDTILLIWKKKFFWNIILMLEIKSKFSVSLHSYQNSIKRTSTAINNF